PLLLLGGATVLLFAGVPVAISLLAVNIVGLPLGLRRADGLEQLVRNSVGAGGNVSLPPIPLFVLIGDILCDTGLALSALAARATPAGGGLFRQAAGRRAVVAGVAASLRSSIVGSSVSPSAIAAGLSLSVTPAGRSPPPTARRSRSAIDGAPVVATAMGLGV